MSSKKKLEQRKEFKEYLSIADKRVLDIKASGIELIANDEIFVLVNGTNNYWVSNHGRTVNNLRNNFHMHKTGYAHYTLSGIDKKIETYTDKLVAEHFLERPDKCNKIWHIDRDKNNCYYRNLIWVNNEEYIDLQRGIMLVEELGRQQEYIPYITLKSNAAYSIWSGIYIRCYICQRRIKNVRKRRLYFVVFRRSHVTFSSASLLKKCVYDLLLLTHEFLAFFQPV